MTCCQWTRVILDVTSLQQARDMFEPSVFNSALGACGLFPADEG